jgi:hypothetical protein
MMNADDRQHRSLLQRIAHQVMLERGLVPDFPPQALAELDELHGPATQAEESTRDLDQLTVAEAMPDGATKVLVAIADVDAVVKKPSALDDHARHNTTSVYTAAETFRCCPRNSPRILPRSALKRIAWPSSLKWFHPGTDHFGVRTFTKPRYVIVRSLLTTAWLAGG